MTERFRFTPARRRRPPAFAGLGRQVLINAIAAVFGLLLLVYLSTDAWWLLPVLVVWVAAGVDQALRGHPAARFSGVTATVIYLFVPVLFTLGTAIFLREVVSGVWNIPAAALAALLLSLAANAEYLTIEITPEHYPNARFVLSLISYVTAFGFFTVVSTSGLTLSAATLVVAVVALLLTVDILRELEVQTGVLFAYAAATGAVVAEVRWAVYYLGLPDLLAGGLLLIAFYEMTGLIQSYLSGHLDRSAIREFVTVGVVGLAVTAAFTIISRRG